MNTQEQVYPSGQHYSARNKIPNIKQFVESLDAEKKARDAQIDSHPPAAAAAPSANKPTPPKPPPKPKPAAKTAAPCATP
jgi:hypothetical protein